MPAAARIGLGARSDLALVRVTVAVAAIASLIVARPAWWGDRVFPAIPGVPEFDLPASGPYLWWSLLAAFALVAWRASAVPVGLTAVLTLVSVAGDVNRLQPWLYQYLLLLACLVGATESPGSRERARLACRLIVAAVYVWSGLQKLNHNFVTEIFPWLLTPVRAWLPGLPWDAIDSPLGWSVGAVETAIGVGLLVPRTRRSAAIGGVLTHLAVLALIGPLGLRWNPVVWPWNLAMGILVMTLFAWPAGVSEPAARPPGASRVDAARAGISCLAAWARSEPLRGLAILLAVVMPLANFADAWDAYLSWSLYSGIPPEATLHVDARLVPDIPDSVRRLAWATGPEGFVLPLVIWSVEELGVPVYPEERVFRAIGGALCRRFSETGALRLELVRKHRLAPKESTFLTCPDLVGRTTRPAGQASP